MSCDGTWTRDWFDSAVDRRNDQKGTGRVATYVGLFGVPAIAAAYFGLLWVVTGSLRRDTRSRE
jgi:hypothetical protein